MTAPLGHFTFVLHSHLPYVRRADSVFPALDTASFAEREAGQGSAADSR